MAKYCALTCRLPCLRCPCYVRVYGAATRALHTDLTVRSPTDTQPLYPAGLRDSNCHQLLAQSAPRANENSRAPRLRGSLAGCWRGAPKTRTSPDKSLWRQEPRQTHDTKRAKLFIHKKCVATFKQKNFEQSFELCPPCDTKCHWNCSHETQRTEKRPGAKFKRSWSSSSQYAHWRKARPPTWHGRRCSGCSCCACDAVVCA